MSPYVNKKYVSWPKMAKTLSLKALTLSIASTISMKTVPALGIDFLYIFTSSDKIPAQFNLFAISLSWSYFQNL